MNDSPQGKSLAAPRNRFGSAKNAFMVVGIIAIIYWLAFLAKSDACWISYLAVGLVAVFLLIINRRNLHTDISRRERRGIVLLTLLLSAMIIASNYDILFQASGQRSSSGLAIFADGVLCIAFFAATGVVSYIVASRGYSLFVAKTSKGEHSDEGSESSRGAKVAPWKCFLICWGLLSLVYLVIFFAGCYPGTVTPDSISQIEQILTGTYSNHHPFYHTQIIRAFMSLGMFLFGDINAAVATYSVFQCLAMAAMFALSIMTMAQAGAKKWMIVATLLAFLLLPYHWSYASTMWKDVLFGGFVLVFVCSIYRMRKSIGSFWLSAVLLIVASFGICLLRSNGPFVFAITGIVLAIVSLVRRKHAKPIPHARAVLVEMGAVFCASLILLGPVISALNVTPVDKIEALSIPAQQIARVVANGDALSDDEYSVLNSAIDVEKIPTAYKSYISNPIKELVRAHDGNEAIEDDPSAFLGLYMKLGAEHPGAYLTAWIDQTRGYWSAGYPYWSIRHGVEKNQMGIEYTPLSEQAVTAINAAQNLTETGNSLNPLMLFYSTGLWMWILTCLAVFNIMARRDGHLDSVILFAIVLSLLIATPVFNEFRYIYALYTCLPFLLYTMTREE